MFLSFLNPRFQLSRFRREFLSTTRSEFSKRLKKPENEDEFLQILASRAASRKHMTWPALEELESFKKRSKEKPSLKIYELMLHLFAESRQPNDASKLWKLMHIEGIDPSSKSYNCIIRCMSRAGKLADGYGFRDEMEKKGVNSTAYTYGALIIGEGVSGTSQKAFELFKEAKEKFDPVPKSLYRTMLGTLSMLKDSEEAARLLNNMVENDIAPETDDYNLAIEAQTDIEVVNRLMAEMDEKGISKNRKTYRIALKLLAKDKSDAWQKCLEVFNSMEPAGHKPDAKLWLQLIEIAENLEVPVDQINVLVLKMKRAGFKPLRAHLTRARSRPMYTKPLKPDFVQPPPRKPFVQRDVITPEGGVWRPQDNHSKWSEVELPKSVMQNFIKFPEDEEKKSNLDQIKK